MFHGKRENRFDVKCLPHEFSKYSTPFVLPRKDQKKSLFDALRGHFYNRMSLRKSVGPILVLINNMAGIFHFDLMACIFKETEF